MFSTRPSTGTCVFSNIRTPRRASASATSCGVDTIRAPSSFSFCAMVSCASPVPGGMSRIMISRVPHSTWPRSCVRAPITIGPRHTIAVSGIDQQADGQPAHAPGFQRDHALAFHVRLAVHAQHLRQAGAVDVRVQQADLVPGARQGHGQVHGGGGICRRRPCPRRRPRYGARRAAMRLKQAGVRFGGGGAVGGQHGGDVEHAGHGRTAGPARFARTPLHHARRLAVGQQGQVHQAVAHRQALHQAGGDDVACRRPGPATAFSACRRVRLGDSRPRVRSAPTCKPLVPRHYKGQRRWVPVDASRIWRTEAAMPTPPGPENAPPGYARLNDLGARLLCHGIQAAMTRPPGLGARPAGGQAVAATASHRRGAGHGAAAVAAMAAGPASLPDLDQLIARINSGLRGIIPNGGGPRRGPSAAARRRARTPAARHCWLRRCGWRPASTVCSRTSRAWCCASAHSTAPPCPA